MTTTLTVKYKVAANGFQPGTVVTVDDSAYVRARLGKTLQLISENKPVEEKSEPAPPPAPAPKVVAVPAKKDDKKDEAKADAEKVDSDEAKADEPEA